MNKNFSYSFLSFAIQQVVHIDKIAEDGSGVRHKQKVRLYRKNGLRIFTLKNCDDLLYAHLIVIRTPPELHTIQMCDWESWICKAWLLLIPIYPSCHDPFNNWPRTYVTHDPHGNITHDPVFVNVGYMHSSNSTTLIFDLITHACNRRNKCTTYWLYHSHGSCWRAVYVTGWRIIVHIPWHTLPDPRSTDSSELNWLVWLVIRDLLTHCKLCCSQFTSRDTVFTERAHRQQLVLQRRPVWGRPNLRTGRKSFKICASVDDISIDTWRGQKIKSQVTRSFVGNR